MESPLANQGVTPHLLHWKVKFNHCAAQDVPFLLLQEGIALNWVCDSNPAENRSRSPLSNMLQVKATSPDGDKLSAQDSAFK